MNLQETKLKELENSVEDYERRSRKRAIIFSLVIPATLLTLYLGFGMWQVTQLDKYKQQLEERNRTLEKENLSLAKEVDNLREERDALVKERNSLIKERDSLIRERDDLLQARNTLIKERGSLTNQIKEAEAKIENARKDLQVINQQIEMVRSTLDNESDQRAISELERNATSINSEVTAAGQELRRPSTSRSGVAIVFAPPSNVRVTPNGNILCSVRNSSTINIYGSISNWYYSDVCGEMGVIHRSQIRF